MEPPRAAPLQIPHEDDVPLFDPSGLSASLSADDWHNSFDLNSVAAARLGISPLLSQTGSGFLSAPDSTSNFTRSDSRTDASAETGSQPQAPQIDSRTSSNDAHSQARGLPPESDAVERGRRRRSSAGQNDSQQGSPAVHAAALPQKDTSVGSKVRMWWERSAAGTPDVDTTDSSIVERDPPSTTLPSLDTDLKPFASSSAATGTTVTSPSSMAQDSSPSSYRSPAADFLSAFSSLNSVVQPSMSYDNRSLSYSPPRSGNRSLGASLMRDETRNGAAAAPGFASWRGLSSAAAQLYDAKPTTAPNPPPRSDDEGARVGPSGRYLLGKTIGVGGFSTVREGWDLEAQGLVDPTAPLIEGQPKGRRVAVKIVYHDQKRVQQDRDEVGGRQSQNKHSQELQIWKSLPSHPHLLPLLHHESVSLNGSHAETSRGSDATAELLIMPYCDQGNLLDFVRAEGGAHDAIFPPTVAQLFSSADQRRSASGSWFVPPSPSEASKPLSRTSSFRTSKNDPSWRHSGPRTGSGFLISRNAGTQAHSRVASVSAASQLRTIPAGQEVGSTASSPVSAAGSVSSGSRLMRRTDSRTVRSQGVPLDAARETMRQLASALLTLHNKCHVLHGDLKLENILGQDQASWKKRQRMSTLSSDGEKRSRQNSGALTDSIDSLASVSVSSAQTLDTSDAVMPCWRIADFGLAQVLDPAQPEAGTPSAPALIRALKEEANIVEREKTGGHKKRQKSSRGGSLAYTAPEYLQARGTPGWSSPTAAATVGEEVDLPPESPFAADMWALGCILYALLSGKLPFTDSFEPRLQMKIAKAQWELPSRLRRRAERLDNLSTSTLTSQVSQSIRNSSTDRAGSVGAVDAADRFAFSQRRPVSGSSSGIGSFGVMDMSASLPALAPRERQLTEPPMAAPSAGTIAVHSDHVVGSAPGRADHLESFEINQAAKARADVEEDPESDNDEGVDPAWDGLSWDRAAARQVLRGLLEPDPRQRWTIDKLCSCAWIRQDGLDTQMAAARIPPTSPPSNNPALSGSSAIVGTGTKGFSPLPTTHASILPEAVSSTLPSEMSRATHFDSVVADGQQQHPNAAGRRSSSLARTRPAYLAHDSPASPSSSAQSPAISMDEEDGVKRRSRSTSRISLRYRDSSRNRSTDVSGSSTPNRERDLAWASHHLATSLSTHTHPWIHAAAKERCDSPADSERRGRMPRSRMADLDENSTWNGEETSRAGSESFPRTGPIAIRGRSQSRSRSRHSGDSSSPERIRHRSVSRSRSTHSVSHDPAGPAGILYGRSSEPQPYVAPMVADQTQAQRSATARSRSRAPDALAQILGRDRSRSRSRARDAMSSRSTPSLLDAESEREQVGRGRSRDRR